MAETKPLVPMRIVLELAASEHVDPKSIVDRLRKKDYEVRQPTPTESRRLASVFPVTSMEVYCAAGTPPPFRKRGSFPYPLPLAGAARGLKFSSCAIVKRLVRLR